MPRWSRGQAETEHVTTVLLFATKMVGKPLSVHLSNGSVLVGTSFQSGTKTNHAVPSNQGYIVLEDGDRRVEIDVLDISEIRLAETPD